MRLMDALYDPEIDVAPAGHTVAAGINHLSALSGMMEFLAGLEEAPVRHVLTPEVAAAATRIAWEQRPMLARAIAHLRVPYPHWWVEWPYNQCLGVLVECGCPTQVSPGKVQPSNVGLLIEADETGRRGTMHIAWRNSTGSCRFALCALDFDFDGFDETAGGVRFVLGDVDRAITDHFRMRIDPFYAVNASIPRQAIADTTQEILPFLAILTLLSAPRATEEVPADLAGINKARAKRRRRLLLDHCEVRWHLSKIQANRHATGSGGVRRPPRFHWVSGHIRITNSGQIVWITPHTRGDAARGRISRTVTVAT